MATVKQRLPQQTVGSLRNSKEVLQLQLMMDHHQTAHPVVVQMVVQAHQFPCLLNAQKAMFKAQKILLCASVIRLKTSAQLVQFLILIAQKNACVTTQRTTIQMPKVSVPALRGMQLMMLAYANLCVGSMAKLLIQTAQ